MTHQNSHLEHIQREQTKASLNFMNKIKHLLALVSSESAQLHCLLHHCFGKEIWGKEKAIRWQLKETNTIIE